LSGEYHGGVIAHNREEELPNKKLATAKTAIAKKLIFSLFSLAHRAALAILDFFCRLSNDLLKGCK